MKIKNALLIPFAALADIVSLGNMGDRSFTQQLFDSDLDERGRESDRRSKEEKKEYKP